MVSLSTWRFSLLKHCFIKHWVVVLITLIAWVPAAHADAQGVIIEPNTNLNNPLAEILWRPLKPAMTGSQSTEFISEYDYGFLYVVNNKVYRVSIGTVETNQTASVLNTTIQDELYLVAERENFIFLLNDSCYSGTLLSAGNRSVSLVNYDVIFCEKIFQKKSAQITFADIELVTVSPSNTAEKKSIIKIVRPEEPKTYSDSMVPVPLL